MKAPKSLILILLFLSVCYNNANAATSSIEVFVLSSEENTCGSHLGFIRALFNNRNIEVEFGHNPNRANPIPHPIKVIWNGKPLLNWDSLLCGFPKQDPLIVGSNIKVHGIWQGSDSFQAYKIEVTQDWKPSFDCSKANMPDEFFVCFNKELSYADVQIERLYKQKMHSADAQRVRNEQREWLTRTRSHCNLDLICLKKAYADRVMQLSK